MWVLNLYNKSKKIQGEQKIKGLIFCKTSPFFIKLTYFKINRVFCYSLMMRKVCTPLPD
jgi:hypothetical protein